jgi:hypothetical protein
VPTVYELIDNFAIMKHLRLATRMVSYAQVSILDYRGLCNHNLATPCTDGFIVGKGFKEPVPMLLGQLLQIYE